MLLEAFYDVKWELLQWQPRFLLLLVSHWTRLSRYRHLYLNFEISFWKEVQKKKKISLTFWCPPALASWTCRIDSFCKPCKIWSGRDWQLANWDCSRPSSRAWSWPWACWWCPERDLCEESAHSLFCQSTVSSRLSLCCILCVWMLV